MQSATSALRAYSRFAERYPRRNGIMMGCLTASVGDIFVQKVVEGRDELDWKRTVVLTAFTSGMYGSFYSWYLPSMDRWFGNGGRALVKKVLVDNALVTPFLYFPVFYATVPTARGASPSQAAARLRSEWVSSNITSAAVYVPFAAANFGLVPPHLRILSVSAFEFVWATILSHIAESGHGEAPDEEPDAQPLADLSVAPLAAADLTSSTPVAASTRD